MELFGWRREGGAASTPSPSNSTGPRGLCSRLLSRAALSCDARGMDLALRPHPDAPPRAPLALAATCVRAGSRLELAYRLDDPGAAVSWPAPVPDGLRQRTDRLWTTTCCELFVRLPGAAGYVEFNFAPAGHWAAYAFDGHRRGMRDLAMARAPQVRQTGPDGRTLVVSLDVPLDPDAPWEASLTTVIDETGAGPSFWALAHAPDGADFHHPATFVLDLSPTHPAATLEPAT